MTTPITPPAPATPGMPSLTPADWAYLRSLGHTNAGTVYNAPVAGDFASVPFNQTYGGQPAPYRDLSTQILDAMQVPDRYTNSFAWNNGANRYNFGGNGQPATPPQVPPQMPPQMPGVQPGLITGVPQSGAPGAPPALPPGGLLGNNPLIPGGGMGGAGAGTLAPGPGAPNVGGGMGGITPGGFSDVAVRPPGASPPGSSPPGAPGLDARPKAGLVGAGMAGAGSGNYTPQAQTNLTPQQYAAYQASAAQANANRQQFAGSMDTRNYDPIAEMQSLQNPLAQFAFYQGHPEYWQAFQQGPQMNAWINGIANSNDAKGVYWGADGTAHGLPTGGGK